MISTHDVDFEKMIKVLQNGSELSLYSYYQIRLNLLRLAATYKHHFHHLVENCLFPEHALHESTKWTLTRLSLMKSDIIDENAKNIILNDLEELGIKSELQQLLWNIKGKLTGNKPWIDQIFECDDYIQKLKNKIAEPFFAENKEISKQLIVEVIREMFPIKFTFITKFWDFLKDNKYPLLLTALVTYGIYDYYHENHMGKTCVSLKNNLFSMWKNTSNSSREEKEQNQNEWKDIGITFMPY